MNIECCPNCENKAVLIDDERAHPLISCVSCGLSLIHENKEELVELWNRMRG